MKKCYLIILLTMTFTSLMFSQTTAPKNLKVSIEKWNGLKYVLLSWDEVSSGSVQYYIYKKEGSLSDSGAFVKQTLPVKGSSYKDKFVMRGQSYSYYVTAYNSHTESEPSDSVEITISDTLSPVLISGTVTDESTGKPLSSGKVVFIPLQGWFNKFAVIDSNGNYSTKVLPGKYIISFNSSKYIPEFYDNKYSIFDAAQVEITNNTPAVFNAALKPFIIPEKHMISGKVTDESGNPLKAIVSVIFLNRNWFKHGVSQRPTDSLGNYSIPVRDGDSVVVYAIAKDRNYIPEFYNDKYELVEADRIYINKDTANVDFMLNPKPVYNNSISGKITDLNGTAVTANVTLFKLRENSHPKVKRTIVTDSLGNFSISNLNPGTYIMHILPEYGFLPTFYTTDGAQTFRWKDADSIIVTETSVISDLNVQVSPVPDSGYAEIEGEITDNDGEAVEGAMVYVVDENSNLVSFGSTNSNGNYLISNLAPGSYSIYTDKFNYDGSQKTGITIHYSGNQLQNVSLTMTALTPTAVGGNGSIISDYKLSQNYPNPFNPSTVINFQVPKTGFVSLKVYNVIGQEVATLINGVKNAGNYKLTFNANGLSSGIYFYSLNAGDVKLTRKMVLIR